MLPLVWLIFRNINMSSKIISQRGALAASTALRTDMDLFFEASADLWNEASNPTGKLPLNMAENNLTWNMMRAEMESVLRNNSIPDWVSNYTSPAGAPDFLEAVAGFMNRYVSAHPIIPSELFAAAGCTAILELMAWVLCDEKDVAVIPAPSYPVYTQDINIKGKVERYDLQTHFDLDNLGDKEILSLEKLETTKIHLEKEGKVFKLLLLTSPDNPTGRIFTQGELDNISNWCIKHEVHLVVNEIYALSIIDTNNPVVDNDYIYEVPFRSFAEIISLKQNPFLHLIYGLSKDFGSSGFRVGLFHSKNEMVMRALGNLNGPHMVSNLTQWLFSKILTNHEFLDRYIVANQERLSRSYYTVVKTLKALNLPYIPARGSLFSWFDLSELLENNNKEQEHKLWMDLYEEEGVLLTPADGFGNKKFGQFRLVHSYLQEAALTEAMKRLKRFVIKRRK